MQTAPRLWVCLGVQNFRVYVVTSRTIVSTFRDCFRQIGTRPGDLTVRVTHCPSVLRRRTAVHCVWCCRYVFVLRYNKTRVPLLLPVCSAVLSLVLHALQQTRVISGARRHVNDVVVLQGC